VLDVLIRGGRVLDGSGAPANDADVAVEDGRVTAVGDLSGAEARTVIDAGERFVAPGFIDIHTHSDIGLLQDPTAENIVRQGVTTHVTGNCGASPAPVAEPTRALAERQFPDYGHPVAYGWSSFGEYVGALERAGVGVNVVPLVGHGTVRLAVLGFERRPPNPDELDRMRAHVEEAMDAGAFGMSTGLVYPPGCFGETDEIVALAEVVARHRGLYASHIRGERETVLDAVRECIAIGERSGARTQISHNAPKWGGAHLLPRVIAAWEEARARGLDVGIDNDAHTDLGWGLRDGLPQWTHELTHAELVAVLGSPDRRRDLIAETVEDARPAYGPVGLLKHGVWERIWLLPGNGIPAALAGHTIAQIGTDRGVDGWTAYLDLIVESGGTGQADFDYIDPEVLRSVAAHPMVAFCSDGHVLPKGVQDTDAPPYMPCSYGEFPGMLERFVVREGLLTVEEAVRKMTSLPASRIGLADRGRLAPGAAADVVVFDLPRVRDRATNLFPHDPITDNYPHRPPKGIDWVLVNGEVAVAEAEPTGAMAGRVLRHGR
jgi:N-acyl-D-amino-acid deacylase